MSERVILCIGTKKGLFVAEAATTRDSFSLRGPFGSGVAVYTALIDLRDEPLIYASSCNAFFGMKILRSTDIGKNFSETHSEPAFPQEDGRALVNIWALEAGNDSTELRQGTTAQNYGAASSPLRSSEVTMAATRGSWSLASVTTSTPVSGSPEAAVSVCIRSSATGIGCISVSRREAIT